MKRKIIIVLTIVTVTALIGYIGFSDQIRSAFFNPTDSAIPQAQLRQSNDDIITSIAQNLDTPWAIAKLPNGRILVTERSGNISIIGDADLKIPVADVVEQGEGGLLGLALHPDFKSNQKLYIYKTLGETNIVESYKLIDDKLADRQDILTGIPAANVHNGGEIKFGPDDKLYITTGDAAVQSQAQDRAILAGKILRVSDDGSTPRDNPFNSPVWSYGHRNPQGLAWDDKGKLWSTEHGPSGLQSGFDELNLIVKGGNYGWPTIRGDQKQPGLISPEAQSGADDTWAPAGMTFADGSLYFTGLRGQSLYEAKVNGDTVKLSRHLSEKYGRLRAVITDGQNLLISTSNQDGRGTPNNNDDQIFRIPLALLKD